MLPTKLFSLVLVALVAGVQSAPVNETTGTEVSDPKTSNEADYPSNSPATEDDDDDDYDYYDENDSDADDGDEQGPAPVASYVDSGKTITTPKVIVTLKQNATMTSLSNSTVASIGEEFTSFNVFVANTSDISIERLRADPNVVSVEEDQEVVVANWWGYKDYVKRHHAPWGLERLNKKHKLHKTNAFALDYTYRHKHDAGEGVNVFVVDTGVRISHEQFDGRARWGATFGGYANADGNGHGTHCAGTVAGYQYGVAKCANIIAVKVLGDNGKGRLSDVIAGLNWVYEEYLRTLKPSVVSMSLGGGASNALDAAIYKLTWQNIHVVVAAGNCDPNATIPCSMLAKDYSPARAPTAITVGSTDIYDRRAFNSVYGPEVDIHAPGVNVISAWSTSDTAINTISGTSMATPHVAGIVASILSLKGNMSIWKMTHTVKRWGIKDAIKDIPDGTDNLLAHIKSKGHHHKHH